jgi:hypothetical protein
MQHIVPYISHQNGFAERKKHILKEMDNCMLQSNELTPHFWAKAINCVNYIVNCTPIWTLKNITSKEA